MGSDEDDAVAGEREVFGGVGGDVGRGDEEPFAPGGEGPAAADAQLDPGEEVGGVVEVDLALGLLGGEQRERDGDVGGLGVPEAHGDVGDAVGLSVSLTFLSLIFWVFVLGPAGAFLAVPLSLLAKALLVDVDSDSSWLRPLLSSGADRPEPATDTRQESTAEET